MKRKIYAFVLLIAMLVNVMPYSGFGSTHREAPPLAGDPLTDNANLYAFRSPDRPNTITIIACYNRGQLPQGGGNNSGFGENIQYRILVENNLASPGEDIIYQVTFKKENQDPNTFFNIRLGLQNQKTTYKLERSMNGGDNFTTIVANGIVPPPNVGPRSISSPFGLNAADYETLMQNAIATATTGEKVFCGTTDDPFFADFGGLSDLADAPRTTGTESIDGLKCLNVSTIALQIPIATLQKDRKPVSQALNILDPSYVIGVWATARRQRTRVLNNNYEVINDAAPREEHQGPWVQVSRQGMPMTNEWINPIAKKELWNFLRPYQDLERLATFGNFYYNPELALFMDDTKFGPSTPAFNPLRVQKNSLGQFGFGNGQMGLFGLKGTSAVVGTALDDAIFGTLLLPRAGAPRSVDIYPLFNTGIPNLRPYQLATGKTGNNPMAAGKPFINNFLPVGGDMLRLNMAVPATARDHPQFSNLGLVQASVLGLTTAPYNTNTTLENIPNMDGFPNGRRLEDDVVRIELQVMSGIFLASLGLWYDDFTPGGNPITPRFLSVLGYDAGVKSNDAPFASTFPYVAPPWPGTHNCTCENAPEAAKNSGNTMNEIIAKRTPTAIPGIALREMNMVAYPNPSEGNSTIKYSVDEPARVKILVYDMQGKFVATLADKNHEAGVYTVQWNNKTVANGTYIVTALKNGVAKQVTRIVKN